MTTTKNNEMAAILALINGPYCVESYRMDGERDDSLFAIVNNYGGYYEIMWQTRGGYGLYAKHQKAICGNYRYKTLGGVHRKLSRMGFAI